MKVNVATQAIAGRCRKGGGAFVKVEAAFRKQAKVFAHHLPLKTPKVGAALQAQVLPHTRVKRHTGFSAAVPGNAAEKVRKVCQYFRRPPFRGGAFHGHKCTFQKKVRCIPKYETVAKAVYTRKHTRNRCIPSRHTTHEVSYTPKTLYTNPRRVQKGPPACKPALGDIGRASSLRVHTPQLGNRFARYLHLPQTLYRKCLGTK